MAYNYTKPRGPIAAQYGSPGPAYGLPTLVGKNGHDQRSTHAVAPAFAFGVRHGKWADESSPGPCYYPNPQILKDGKNGAPQYSIYSRPKDGTLHVTPGPGAYTAEKAMPQVFKKDPAYSFGLRTNLRGTDETPAPNAYTVPACVGKTVESDKSQAPAVSITGRSKIGGFHEDLQKTPGPGAYTQVKTDLYKNKQPHFSITGRNECPGDTTVKPGPGAYKPEGVKLNKKGAPAFSFGIRHSQYSGTLITDTDCV